MTLPPTPAETIHGNADGTAYSVVGSGAPLVLVHGLGMHRGMWMWQVPDLAERFTVITYDLLGHAESRNPPENCTLSDFSDQLAALCHALDLRGIALAGFSLGGMIVRSFTLAHPDRVNALAILHSAHNRTSEERATIMVRVHQAAETGPSATVDAALQRWFSDNFRAANPDVMGTVRDAIMANDPAVYPSIYRVLAQGDEELATAITAIQCPTLVMTGSEDYGNSADMSRRMAASIPGAECVILPGLRHMALAEDPVAFNMALISFLELATV
jgi:pimeloyl-ACP methyl ester carboxylesterase